MESSAASNLRNQPQIRKRTSYRKTTRAPPRREGKTPLFIRIFATAPLMCLAIFRGVQRVQKMDCAVKRCLSGSVVVGARQGFELKAVLTLAGYGSCQIYTRGVSLICRCQSYEPFNLTHITHFGVASRTTFLLTTCVID